MTGSGTRLSLLSLLTFGALTLAFTHPLILHAGVAVEDWHDALLNVWIMAWDAHQLTVAPLHLFNANIFYPNPQALAFSEILLSQALVGMPITLATGNPVLAYNLVLLSTFCFSGLGAGSVFDGQLHRRDGGWCDLRFQPLYAEQCGSASAPFRPVASVRPPLS